MGSAPRPSGLQFAPAGNYARYIGRVGALALSLGVGAAVTTGHGLGTAFADTGTPAQNSPANDAPSTDPTSKRPAGSTDSDESTNSPATDDASSVEDAEPAPEPDDADQESVEAEFGSAESDGPASDAGPATPSGTPDILSPATSAAEAVTPEASLPSVVEPDGPAEPSATDAVFEAPEQVAAASDAATSSADRSPADPAPDTGTDLFSVTQSRSVTIDLSPQTLSDDVAATVEQDGGERRATGSAAHIPVGEPTPLVAMSTTIAPPVTAASLVRAFVSSLLSPFIAPSPAAPYRQPLLWAVLGWVHRQIQRTFYNRTPDVRPQAKTLVLGPGETSDPISFNGYDYEEDPITYFVPTRGVPGGPSHGTVVVDQSTGTFTYTPDAGYTGADHFTVTASDAWNSVHRHGLFGFLRPFRGHTDSATITLDIVAPAAPPVVNNDAYTTTENSAVVGNVLSNDSDPDHENLIATLLSEPSNGSVTLEPNGVFSYTPNAGWSGADEFTYTASNFMFSATASVTITVTPVNQAPLTVDDSYETAEDSPVTGNLLDNDSDREGSALTASLVLSASHGDVELDPDGSFTYTPNPDFHGIDAFSYVASDGVLLSPPTLVTITVTPVNDPPVARDDVFAINEDSILTGSVLFNDSDVDGDPLAAALSSGPSHGEVTLNSNGTFSYTPVADYSGTDSFTYTVSDSTATSAATATITVNPVNDAPVASDGSFVVAEGATHIGNLTISDVDGDTLSVTVGDGPNHGTLLLGPDGSFTYTPDAQYSGHDWFTFTVSDDSASSAPAVMQITVTAVNNAPVAQNDAYTMNENAILTGKVTTNDTDADNDTLTVTVESGPGKGLLTLAANGSFTYTPNADYNGTDSFTYTVSDGTATSNIATVTITINAVNNAPAANDDLFNVDEDAVLTGNVLANDSDVESTSLTAALVDGPVSGTLDLDADGSFTYTPAPDFHGVDWFTYTASDGSRTSAPAMVVIVVAPVNDAPVAVNDTFTTAEGSILTGNVLANDTDVDADSLTVTLIGSPANGSLLLRPDGSFVYVPAANYNGTEEFTYVVSDGVADSATATATISVTPVNNAPVAVTDSFSTDEDSALTTGNVLANDTDVDGDTLTAALVAGPSSGTLTLNADGSFTYTPNDDFNGTDSFTYTAADNVTTSSVATVNITVKPVNDAPVAAGDSFAIAEDTVLAGNVLSNDSDIDGDTLSAILVAGPSSGDLTLNADGSFTYTPDTDFHGDDSFTYQVNDGTADGNTATVSLTVTPANDAPVATGDSFAGDEDTELAGNVLSNDSDIDGDTLSAILVTGPSSGDLTLNADGSFTYTPGTDFHGEDSFTYKVNDGTVDGNTATVSLTVTPVNDAPVAGDDAFTFDEDHILEAGVLDNDTDVDGDSLTVALVDGPSAGELTLNADGSFTYTPNADFHGDDTFTYKVNDGTADGNTATVSLTVTPVNDAPVADNDSFTTDEDTALTTGNVLANDGDVDGDSLTATVVSGPAHGSLTLNADGSFTYTPNADFAGLDSFTYRASDESVVSNTALVTIAITAVNDAPVAGADSVTTNEDTQVTGNVLINDTDVDGDTLTATVVSGPSSGTLTLDANGTFTYTPNADFNGTDSFTYSASDGPTSSVATVSITVNPVNDEPVAVNDSFTTDEDTPLTTGNVLDNDTDVDGDDDLTAMLVTGPANGDLILNEDGTFSYTPDADFHGTDNFTYKVNDGTVDGTTGVVSITVNPVNDAPVAVNDTYTTNEDTQLSGNVLDNDTDVDGDNLSAAVVSGPSSGTLTLNGDGTFTYTPDADFNGTDSFTYTAGDGPTSSVATVNITINPVNDAPVAVNDSFTTDEDTPLTSGNVLTNDTDADGDTLTAILGTGPTHGTLTLNANGTFTYTPDADYSGTDVFTYKINDGTVDSSTAIVSIVITAANDAPVAVDDTYTTNEDTVLTGNVLDNDSDVDDAKNTLTVSLVVDSGPANGNVTLNSDGSFTYTPNANYNGTDIFTYEVSDGTLGDTATVTITINEVNNAPVANNDTFTTDEDTPLSGNVLDNDTDVDGDTLTATVDIGPSHGSLTLNGDGSFTYTPDANHNGDDSFTYTVSDGDGDDALSDTATVTITINEVNDAPVAVNDTFTTPNGVSISGNVLDNDSDVDSPKNTLTATVVTGPANGTLTLNEDGSFNYTPNGNLHGTDSFTYTTTDGPATSDPATVTINIAPKAVGIQTTNETILGGGIMQAGDTITYTFSEPIDPASILLGWNGSTTDVVVRAYDGNILLGLGGDNDSVQIFNAANNQLLPLGTVDLGRGDYVTGGLFTDYVTFGAILTPSKMTMSGNTITIELGTYNAFSAANIGAALGTGTMVWTPSTTPTDLAGNALSGTPVSESGGADRDF